MNLFSGIYYTDHIHLKESDVDAESGRTVGLGFALTPLSLPPHLSSK